MHLIAIYLSSPTIGYVDTRIDTYEIFILNVVTLKVREFTAFLYGQYPIVGHTQTNINLLVVNIDFNIKLVVF